MEIKECMTKDVDLITPETSIADAAKKMLEDDVGALLVRGDDRLVGVLTDRDIVIRALAAGLEPSASVGDIMTKKVLYCYDDDSIEAVADNMGKNQIHRLVVLNHDKRLVGIVSLGDLSTKGSTESAAIALCAICQPTGH